VQDGKQSPPRVLVVGSTMTDMIAYASVFPGAGETVVGESFALGFGGKGANQAVMAALLGASVQFVGSLGNDVFGEMTLENLKSFGIDTSSVVVTEGEASGAAPIWVDSTTGENRIIVVPGANNHLPPDLVRSVVESARPAVVLTQLELPDDCVRAALDAAARIGCAAILNPAPMREVSRELLERPDWVIPNETELVAIARLLGLETADGVAAVATACARTLGSNVVVTLGSDGALICRPGERPVPVDAPPAAAVDTTGAGDAFVGAFAYALANAASPTDAASFACACASASVNRKGTQTSFPRGDEVDRLKAKGERWHVSQDR
jgi:ribokinase